MSHRFLHPCRTSLDFREGNMATAKRNHLQGTAVRYWKRSFQATSSLDRASFIQVKEAQGNPLWWSQNDAARTFRDDWRKKVEGGGWVTN